MRRFVQAACVATALALGTLARADDAATAEGQARLNEGLALEADAKLDEARLKFLQAYAVLKTPPVLFHLASAEAQTGHEVDAIEHYRAFLERYADDPSVDDAMRAKAKESTSALSKSVAQIAIEAPAGSKPSIDGKAGNGPKSEAKSDAIVSSPDTYRGRFKPNVGERTTAGWIVPITLGALGVGGMVMGGLSGAASQRSKDASEKLARPGLCTDPTSKGCSDYDARRSDAESRASLSFIGYGAGGFCLVASVLTYLYWPRSGKPPAGGQAANGPSRIVVTPDVGPRAGGGSVQVRF